MNDWSLSTVDYRETCNRSLATVSKRGLDLRVIVYDHTSRQPVFDAEMDVQCSCCNLSFDGRYVAIGYWDRADIDVWELETLHRRRVKTPSRISRVFFDKTDDWLVYQSERGTYAMALAEAAPTRIVHADDLFGAAHRVRDNVMLVPLRRKGQIAAIAFDPVVVETATLSIGSVIRSIRHSPKDNTLFIIDGTGTVYGYDDELRHVTWKTPVKERPFTGTYCGDGSLIGLHATQFSGPPTVVVLESRRGVRDTEHPGRSCVGVPFTGDTVLLRGVHPGPLLHLRDGQESEGLAAAFGVHLFSLAGIPVSTSQAVVGGVIGVGLTKGMKAVSTKKISTIFIGWVVTPTCAAVFAAIVYRLVD